MHAYDICLLSATVAGNKPLRLKDSKLATYSPNIEHA